MRSSAEITATNGVIDQLNFYDYPVARIHEAPYRTNLYVVESTAPAAGVGRIWSVGHCAGALERHLCCYRQKDQGAAAFEKSAHLRMDFPLHQTPAEACARSLPASALK
jgi:hypothetical protein